MNKIVGGEIYEVEPVESGVRLWMRAIGEGVMVSLCVVVLMVVLWAASA